MLDNFQDIEEIVKIIEFETGHTTEEIAKSIGITRSHLTVILKQGASDRVLESTRNSLKSAYKKQILHFVSRYGKITLPNEQILNEILERVKSVEISLNFLAGDISHKLPQSHIESTLENAHKSDVPNDALDEATSRTSRQQEVISKRKKENLGQGQ